MTLRQDVVGLVFADDFDRADGAPGANYTVESGTWAIVSNKLKVTNAGNATIHVSAVPIMQDTHIQVTINRDNLALYAGVLGRATTAPNILWIQSDTGASTDGNPNKPRVYSQFNGPYFLYGLGALNQAGAINTDIDMKFSLINDPIFMQAVAYCNGFVNSTQDPNPVVDVPGKVKLWVATGGGIGMSATFNDLKIMKSRYLKVVGLPAGYKIRSGGITSAAAVGGVCRIDAANVSYPHGLLEILDTTLATVDSVATVYGGDVFTYNADVPNPDGSLVYDLDPVKLPTAVQVNATALTLINSGLNPIPGSPTFRTAIFPTGKPSIRTVAGTQGFYIDRPVANDFTIYIAARSIVGNGAGASYYQNGSFIDCEQGGVQNDFCINVRADGKLSAGTGNPDTTVTGTHLVNDGAAHIITVTRKKSTGVMKVYVDDVLDITVTNNANPLSASPNMYFGNGASVLGSSVEYGRGLMFGTIHTDPDRLNVSTTLKALYIGSIIEMTFGGAAVALTGTSTSQGALAAGMGGASAAIVGTVGSSGAMQVNAGGASIAGEIGHFEDNPYPLGRREITADFVGHRTGNVSITKRPDAISFDYLSAFSMGPRAIGDISLGPVDRPWYVRVDNAGKRVMLAKSNDLNTAWNAETVAFNFVGVDIEEIDLAFDQSGNSVITAERKSGVAGAKEIWLYWFKPALGAFTFEMLEAGRTSRILLDNPGDPTNSDVTLFYLKPGVGLVYRVQRELYAIVHATPHLDETDWYVEDAFYTRGYRVAVFMVKHNPGGTYGKKRLESSLMPIYTLESMTFDGELDRGTIRVSLFIFTDDPAYATTKVGNMLKDDYFTYGAAFNPGAGTLAAVLLTHVLYDIEKMQYGGTIDSAALTDPGTVFLSHTLYDEESMVYAGSIAPGGNTLATAVILHTLYDIEKMTYTASFGAGGTLV